MIRVSRFGSLNHGPTTYLNMACLPLPAHPSKSAFRAKRTYEDLRTGPPRSKMTAPIQIASKSRSAGISDGATPQASCRATFGRSPVVPQPYDDGGVRSPGEGDGPLNKQAAQKRRGRGQTSVNSRFHSYRRKGRNLMAEERDGRAAFDYFMEENVNRLLADQH